MNTIRIQPGGEQPAAASVGNRIGGYQIIRQLGCGGMGTVFEAEEVDSGRRVALKVLNRGLDSPVSRERFRREGLLAASMNHPNTVYVYGTNEIDGHAIIAMELVSGGTLHDWIIPDRPTDVTQVVDAILQVIAGLEAAAARGVLHRDIKPSNCFIETDGTIKVGDFGLAFSQTTTDMAKLTVDGSFLGTPSFSPPEQIRGETFTIQGDIYAVGVTLYYLLTGRTPFEGPDPLRILSTVLERPADSPLRWRAELPSGLGRTILRCLEKQPSKRFKNYAQLRQALLPYSSVAATPAALTLRFLAACIDGSMMMFIGFGLSLLTVGRWDAFFNPQMYPESRRFIGTLGLVLNLLYFGLPEGRWGMSLGKRICGIRVVGPNRGVPGFPRAFLRAFLIESMPAMPSLVYVWLDFFPVLTSSRDVELLGILSGFAVFLTPLFFLTARRRNGFAGIHDLLTRTRVVRQGVHGARPTLKAVAIPSPPPADALEVGAYQLGEVLGKSEAGEIRLGYDRRLLRTVWIHQPVADTPMVSPERRRLARPGRPRWLGGRRSGTECWDAYDVGHGRAWVDLIARRQTWEAVRFWMLDLAEELAVAGNDRTSSAVLALDRVWITDDGRARLLDFPAPIGRRLKEPHRLIVSQISPISRRFLAQIAKASLTGQIVGAGDATLATIGAPLPPHAREILTELQAGLEPGKLVDRIKGVMGLEAVVSVRRRAAILLGCCGVPAVSVIFGALMYFAASMALQNGSDPAELRRSLGRWNAIGEEHSGTNSAALELRQRMAFEVYIPVRFRSSITNAATWNTLAGALIPMDQREAAEQWVKRPHLPSDAEFKQAAAIVEPLLKEQDLLGFNGVRRALHKPAVLVGTVAWTFVISSAVPSLLATLLFRDGLVLRTLRVMVVRWDGRRASRIRLVWRSLLAWSPLFLAAIASAVLSRQKAPKPWEFSIGLLLGMFIAGLLVIWLALLPKRGLHDRLAGTCLVPRE